MSEPAPANVVEPDPRDDEIIQLKKRIAELEKPSPWERVKARLARVANGLLAAVTSAEAVKAEKSIATLVVARLLLYFGAGAATSDVVYRLLRAVGLV